MSILDTSGAEVYVAQRNLSLKPGWSSHLGAGGRIYYCNHGTQTASWLPPADNWDSALPFGWEIGTDKEGKQYFINHHNKTTTYEDPRKEVVEEPPQPRDVELFRDAEMGFGFVAGSEKPVIVRFVTDGGPSVDKLLPGDQILKINGEDVKKAPREHVIELVRSCKHSVLLTVCQPHSSNSMRKSALLSAAKKARLKSNPSRVRFAEGVVINGSPLLSPSSYSSESCIPFMPNVLKVFLENGQTKSFKYDSSTTVLDVLESLQQKLAIKRIQHFSLVVEHIKSLRRNKLTLLDPRDSLARIAARPGAQHLRCLFRVAFVPRDAYDLLREDPISFEYLYTQCCNDVVQERFAPELKYDIALRLAALHIQQHAITNNIQGKLSVKHIERECGLERFVPMSLVETMKHKELRKLLTHFLKLNQNLSAPGQRTLTALQAKLHYLKIIGELPSYGAKCFTTNLRDSNMETVVLVSPKFGISQFPGLRNSMPLTLAEVEDLAAIYVYREDELSYRVELQLQEPNNDENIVLSLEDREAEELVLLLQGYYQLLTDKDLPVHQEKDRWVDDSAPPYHTQHKVLSAEWNYANSNDEQGTEHNVDLSTLPAYKPASPKIMTANGHVPSPRKNGNIMKGSNNGGMAVAVVHDIMAMDKNMNAMTQKTPPAERKAFSSNQSSPASIHTEKRPLSSDEEQKAESPKNKSHTAQTPSRGNDIDFNTMVTMEMLKNGKRDQEENRVEHKENSNSFHFAEAKNEEVIRRVVEMQHIVRTAESYLTGEDPKPVPIQEPEPTSADQLPPLKAADSLLLLNHVGREADLEAVRRLEVAVDEPSGSDTDSMSTPTDSPSHRPEQRRAVRPTSGLVGSSFGLHSPDNLPVSLHKANLHELLHRLQDENQLPYPFAEGTLYLDPDIIDLTMIPPPITPDREGVDLPMAISMPPTPFADRQTLEAELRALEVQFQKEAQSLESTSVSSKKPVSCNNSQGVLITTKPSTLHFTLPSPCVETNNFSSFGKNQLSSPPPPPRGWGSGDIDTFIASVSVPPPPPPVEAPPPQVLPFPEPSPVIELTPEDISAFIIPPPPPTSTSAESDSEIIARLQQAAERVKEVVSHGSTLPRMSRPPNRFVLNLQHPRSIGMAAGKKHLAYLESHTGDSSGYETQTSSTVSCSEQKEEAAEEPDMTVVSGYAPIDEYISRTVGCSVVNDAASITSGESSTASGGTECAGTQGDTEDSTNEDSTATHLASRMKINAKGTKQLTQSQRDAAYQRERVATSSESDEATCIFQSSPLSSDDGQGCIPTPPLRWAGTLPHSRTLQQPIHNTQWMDKQSSLQCNKSVSSEFVLEQGSLKDRSLDSSTERNSNQKMPPSKDGSKRMASPSKKLNENNIVMETDDVPYTGTILKSPHMSPTKLAQKNVVKPPLPPSPSLDATRRAAIPKMVGTIASPSPERKISNNRSRIHVPKPVLPKTSVKSPPTISKNVSFSNHVSNPPPSSSHETDGLKRNVHSPKRDDRSPKSITVKYDNENCSVISIESSFNDVNSKDYTINGVDSYGDNVEISSIVSEGLNSGANAFAQQTAPLQRAEEVVGSLISHLDDVLDQAGRGVLGSPSKEKLISARDSLVTEARRFVTASKLFVKGATESEQKLIVHLGLCVTLLERMLQVTEVLASNTLSPLQTQNLALKVRDVASTYMQTTRAAAVAAGKPMNDPSMHLLMQQATTLAAVLTALMRTLRAFNP